MRVDHLVWYNADLDEGRREIANWTDGPSADGGIHPGEGTRNALIGLADDTYVEILGRDPQQPLHNLDPEIRALTDSGLYHWAAGGADLLDLQARIRAAGLEASEIITGGRVRPNGKWIGWKLLGIKNHGFGALLPFFIDWGEHEHPAVTTPRGGRLLRLDVSSPEPDRLNAIYRLLGLDLDVVQAGHPAFSAVIESSKGRFTARMFDPIPRGYVI